ncbi:MAG: cyclic nucleotide-binding domain-containing protein [Elusimicrobiaceae bacterium]|nr:cyclic nucleotide-binding domain-containing protein [Elusimicrobiaceae bacterium]
MPEPAIERLKALSFFTGFPDAAIALFQAKARRRVCAPDETVLEENVKDDRFYVLLSGRVIIAKRVSEEGEAYAAKPLADLGAGEFFGEMQLFDNMPSSARATAVCETELLELGREDFEEMIRSDPATGFAFYSRITKALTQRLRATSAELAMLFDISELLFRDFAKESGFLSKLLSELRLHLGYDWRLAAFIYNVFSEEYEPAGACGPGPAEGLPASDRLPGIRAGWLDGQTYAAVLPGDEKPDGCLFFQAPRELTRKERDRLAIPFDTVARIANSAVDRIRYARENALRDRLERNRQNLF